MRSFTRVRVAGLYLRECLFVSAGKTDEAGCGGEVIGVNGGCEVGQALGE